MRNFSFISLLLLLLSPALIGQNMHDIVVKKSPPSGSLCYSSCDECGKLIFITFISNLKFESSQGNITEQRVQTEVNANGYEKFTYHVVTKAQAIQHITIKGSNVADYDLTVYDLKPVDCQEFLINFETISKPAQTGSFLLATVPAGASVSILGEPQISQVTPYSLTNHQSGTYSVRLEKAGYYAVDTLITIKANETSQLTLTLIPTLKPDLPKDLGSVANTPITVLENIIKKHGKNQSIWLTSAIVAGGAGGFFLVAADLKYKEYLKSTDSQAAELHKAFSLYDKLGPAFLGVAGICAIEFTIQTVKKGKARDNLKLQIGGSGGKLTYRF